MTVRARSATSVDLPAGDVWAIDVRVLDADGCPVEDTVTVAVTLPDGTSAAPVAESLTLGRYRAEYVVAAVGRYVARVTTAAYGAADFAAYVTAVVTGANMPDIADLGTYLGTHSHSDDDLQEALDAEAAAQRRVCRVPAAYSADLRSALLRRAQFHLAMKRVTLGVIPGDGDRDTIRPGFDSEVRRFERPYRKLPMG
jgi:hypothetical protein